MAWQADEKRLFLKSREKVCVSTSPNDNKRLILHQEIISWHGRKSQLYQSLRRVVCQSVGLFISQLVRPSDGKDENKSFEFDNDSCSTKYYLGWRKEAHEII